MRKKAIWVTSAGLCVVAAWWAITGPGFRGGRAQAVEWAKHAHDFGLTAAFEEEVKKVGQITPEEFGRRYAPKAAYLEKVSWDPTTAKYWDRFMLDPNDPKAMTPIRNLGPKEAAHLFDFRPNEQELSVLRRNGFVVSERMGSHSFTDLYYRLYVRDLPVFVSSDSMLHAWHRFFDRFLEQMEQDYFRPEFRNMLSKLAEQIPAAQKAYGDSPMADALKDVDFFLAVADALLDQGKAAGSRLGQEGRVAHAVNACSRYEMDEFPLFGRLRPIDFSQFKPRGRYAERKETQRYFQAVMWLGRIDFRIAGSESADQDLREFSGAVVLHDLLQRARMVERWQQLDRVLLHLVGKSDSLNFSQLGAVLAAAGVVPANVTHESLSALRTRILESNVGEQHIRGEWFKVDPGDPRKFVLPRTFAFMGQRFILDSWALSKIVYDDILWTDEKSGDSTKVQRRIPSCLDVGFAVFGNDHFTPLLTARMQDQAGKKFRDGLPYQHNLAAVRNVIERLPESTWRESLYADWVGCLRELSKPTVTPQYPESMRTPAWALKTAATQLASWTQLRHDTVLYAKPSYTSGQSCEYPAGFVEPVPHFWKRFKEMIQRTQDVVANTTFPDDPYRMRGEHLRERYLRSLENFAKTAGMLQTIAEKEIVRQELSEDETKFLKEVVVRGGGSGLPPVSGWYPNLFTRRSTFKDQDDAHKWVALVADVHTDPPSLTVPDPGCVVHQAVGNVDALIIAIDNGKDRMVYAGPVFSHYEFETPNAVRRTNAEWHDALRAGKQPPRPEWTASFVVSGVNPEAKDYGKVDKRWGK
ncbi:MAG: DUF3160 domain-containing protein [Planctomycetes bacterium]|nr:DUF3160 domain-containing protein [Planctomycetota bacterium]